MAAVENDAALPVVEARIVPPDFPGLGHHPILVASLRVKIGLTIIKQVLEKEMERSIDES